MPSESNVTLSRAWCVEALPGMAWAGVGLETEAQNLAVNIVVTLFTYTAKCHVLESIRRPQFGRIDPQTEHIFKTPKREITRKSSASHHPGDHGLCLVHAGRHHAEGDHHDLAPVGPAMNAQYFKLRHSGLRIENVLVHVLVRVFENMCVVHESQVKQIKA